MTAIKEVEPAFSTLVPTASKTPRYTLTHGTYQAEGAEHREPLHIGQAQLHQAQGDDDAVKDVPALLEILVGIQSNELQDHLRREDPRKDLWETAPCHFACKPVLSLGVVWVAPLFFGAFPKHFILLGPVQLGTSSPAAAQRGL